MSEQQKACCDSFVYISQHGGGTASLNVTVAASIILHRYAGWRADSSCGGGASIGTSGGAVSPTAAAAKKAAAGAVAARAAAVAV